MIGGTAAIDLVDVLKDFATGRILLIRKVLANIPRLSQIPQRLSVQKNSEIWMWTDVVIDKPRSR
jgi:hypothetical protein